MTKTNAIGVISKTGLYGITFTHQDIVFEIAMWIKKEFKVFFKANDVLTEK